MDEHNYRRFQAVMQIASTVGAVIVFFLGLQRYHDQQADLIRTRVQAEQFARDREFRRDLWLRQLDVLSKVALRHEIRYFREGLEPIDGLTAADKVKQKAYGVASACRAAIFESGKDYLPLPGMENQ
ncbi:MAG TPA: hypothetical protein VGC99_27330 [Candidatus Tectomicrobia bacterium]